MFKTEMKIITQAIQFLAGGTASELPRPCLEVTSDAHTAAPILTAPAVAPTWGLRRKMLFLESSMSF